MESASRDELPPIGTLRRVAFLRALRLACPQCGAKPLFRAYGRLRERCGTCELVLRREQGAQTGSMYVTAAVGQLFACALIWIAWLFTSWSPAVFFTVAVPLVLAFCALLLPFSQAFWVAVEYVTDAVNREAWVQPRL